MIKLILLFLSFSAFAYDPKVNTLLNTNFINPDFSGPVVVATSVPYGWNKTTGTVTKTTTAGEVSELGGSAMKIVPSGNAFDVDQTITLAAGELKQNVVGFNYRIPATCSGVSVKIFVDGSSAAQSTLISSSLSGGILVLDDTFRTIEIPTTTSSATPSIKLNFTAATTCTGNIFFSKTYRKAGIGTQALQLDSQTSRTTASVPAPVSGTAAEIKFNTTRTEGGSGLISITEGASWTYFTARQIVDISFTATAAVGTGGYIVILLNGAIVSTSSGANASGDYQQTTFNGRLNIGDELKVSAGAALRAGWAGYNFIASPAASSAVYSQASANYDWTSYTPTTPNSSFAATSSGITVASNDCQYKRNGSDLLLKCKFTAGTVQAQEAQISLPPGLTSADTSKIATILVAGIWGKNENGASSGQILIEPSKTYVTFGIQSAGANNLTKALGTGLSGNAVVFSINARIPILGWSEGSTIVGSFAGVPSVPGYQGIVDTFSVSYGTTNLATNCTTNSGNCYIDQIGNEVVSIVHGATNSGAYTLNFLNTYSKVMCTGNALQVGVDYAIMKPMVCVSGSCTSVTTGTSTSAGAAADTIGTIACKGIR